MASATAEILRFMASPPGANSGRIISRSLRASAGGFRRVVASRPVHFLGKSHGLVYAVPDTPPVYYHPPATVAYYPASGCYNCATAGAVAVGVVVGAAVATSAAKANTAAATTSAYNAGVAAGSASTAAATSTTYASGYSAGVAAASATQPTYVQPGPGQPAYVLGGTYATLPPGCITPSVGGITYYQCGYTWFKPIYGANGVHYTVVPAQQP